MILFLILSFLWADTKPYLIPKKTPIYLGEMIRAPLLKPLLIQAEPKVEICALGGTNLSWQNGRTWQMETGGDNTLEKDSTLRVRSEIAESTIIKSPFGELRLRSGEYWVFLDSGRAELRVYTIKGETVLQVLCRSESVTLIKNQWARFKGNSENGYLVIDEVLNGK